MKIFVLTLGFFLAITPVYADITTGMLGYWAFDEGSGAQTLDLSGNSQTASLVNNLAWTPGKYGKAVQLNGIDQYINPEITQNLSQFTIAGWFNASTSNVFVTLADNMSFAAGYGGINLRSNRLYLLDSSGKSLVVNFSQPVNWLNTWNHYIATYDGFNAKIYINGRLVATQAGTLGPLTTTNVLRIGTIAAGGGMYFQGLVDEVRIYSRALSDQEAVDLYNYIPISYPPLTGVNITSPVAGATVSGDVSVTATATGGGKATQVQFSVDGKPLGKIIGSMPFELSWHTISASNGAHLIGVSATDETGAVVDGNTILVNVNNSLPDPYYPKTKSNEFYVSLNGSPTGDGSWDKPWDLQTALSQPKGVKGGDTIWVRGGRYQGGFTSTLTGSSNAPIILRQYPGERATIDNPNLGAVFGLNIQGQYAWYWGLELVGSSVQRYISEAGSNPSSRRGTGVIVDGSDVKLINMIVHDFGDGIFLGANAAGTEVNGVLLYYNGWQGPDRGHGHGIYAQNNTNTLKKITDVVSFYNFATGMKAYAEGAYASNFLFDGVTLLNNGGLDSTSGGVDNFTIGTIKYPLDNISILNSQFYLDDGAAARINVMLGYSNPSNTNIIFQNNYVVAPVYPMQTQRLISANISNNKMFLLGHPQVSWRHAMYQNLWSGSGYKGLTINNNDYYYNQANAVSFSQPSIIFNAPGFGVQVGDYVDFAGWQAIGFDTSSHYTTSNAPLDSVQYRLNMYEPRATVIVWNWSGASDVNIDGKLAGLTNTDTYEVTDAENYLAGPIASGVYNGGNITIPMKGLSLVRPIGSVPIPPVHTSPKVGVFYIQKKKGISNVTNPTSGIGGDQTRPSIPKNLTADSTMASQVKLTWSPSTDNAGIGGYEVFRDGAPIGSTTTTAYVDTTVSPSTQYSYAVSAYDLSNNYSGVFLGVQVTTAGNSVGNISYGDVNGDGTVNVADALLTAQDAIGSITLTLTQKQAADVSGNGQVTMFDAVLITQYSTGKINNFPAQH